MVNLTSIREEEQLQPAGRLDLFEAMLLLAGNWRFIAKATIATAVLAVIISFLLPKTYTATARIIPPQNSGTSAAMLLGSMGAGGGSPMSGLSSLLTGKSPSELYVAMLKSRTIADHIIQKFELMKVYRDRTMADTRKDLAENTSISAGKEGVISIEVQDKNAERAAGISNEYVAALSEMTENLAVTEASQRRQFFEKQLLKAKDDLANAEIELKKTQLQTGLIMPEQARGIVEGIARVRAQIAATEVQLQAVRSYATPQNPEVIRMQQVLGGLRAQLAKLEKDAPAGADGALLSSGQIPEAGMAYLRKYRDLKYHETIFELMAKQFELAKLDEAKDFAAIQVVDRAVVPDKKSKPKRLLIVLLSTLAALLLACSWTLTIGRSGRTDPEFLSKLHQLRTRFES